MDIQTFGEVRVGRLVLRAISSEDPLLLLQPEAMVAATRLWGLAADTDWIVLLDLDFRDQLLHSTCLMGSSLAKNSHKAYPLDLLVATGAIRDGKCLSCDAEVPAFVYFLL